MATISFKAFSFLQNELRASGYESFDDSMEILEGQTVDDVLRVLGLDREKVEAAFVNGRIAPFSTVLKDRDRLALVPPGTPGPYRVLLGIRDGQNKHGGC
ncbi:MAG: MoaD/ThiS family protein [Desulfonatronovibrio sp.]